MGHCVYMYCFAVGMCSLRSALVVYFVSVTVIIFAVVIDKMENNKF